MDWKCVNVVGDLKLWAWGWAKGPSSMVEWDQFNSMQLVGRVSLDERSDIWRWRQR
ncbi:hypothetical protein Hanom_Chr07g00641981 [Helianthus anomalus]